MPKEAPISAEMLESLCKVLGDQNTGSEIGNYLAQSQIEDIDQQNTKWRRLFNAFAKYQNDLQESNRIQIFIQRTLSPVRYANKHEQFEQYRIEVNTRLAFIGLELLETGKYRRISKAETIPEAQKRADAFKRKLDERKVHPDVLAFCKAELLQDNYFHAVFEATKSVAEKIRQKSGLKEDGSALVDMAFGLGEKKTPRLAFNSLANESEESEHKGFANLLKGMFGMFRNTTGHAPKIKWLITEETALDCLTLASLLHKTLDKAFRTPY
jgi:uncharacterized protein (TIGR02391 family)